MKHYKIKIGYLLLTLGAFISTMHAMHEEKNFETPRHARHRSIPGTPEHTANVCSIMSPEMVDQDLCEWPEERDAKVVRRADVPALNFVVDYEPEREPEYDARGYNGFHRAIERNEIELAKIMRGHGTNVFAVTRNKDQSNAMHIAALHGHLQAINYLHDTYSFPVDTLDNNKKRPLFYALVNNHHAAAFRLCSLGGICDFSDLETIIRRDWDGMFTEVLKNPKNKQVCCQNLKKLLDYAVLCTAFKLVKILSVLLHNQLAGGRFVWDELDTITLLNYARFVEKDAKKSKKAYPERYNRAESIVQYLEKEAFPEVKEHKTPVVQARSSRRPLDVRALGDALPEITEARSRRSPSPGKSPQKVSRLRDVRLRGEKVPVKLPKPRRWH